MTMLIQALWVSFIMILIYGVMVWLGRPDPVCRMTEVDE